MKRSDYLGMPVRLVENTTISVEHIPGWAMSTIECTTEDEFVVEHDFRDSEEAGIRVGTPSGSWMSLTSKQFAKLFGKQTLEDLDAITYEGSDAQ